MLNTKYCTFVCLKCCSLSRFSVCYNVRSSNDDGHMANSFGGISRITMPRHISLPPLPADSELMFEIIAFVFTSMALFLQLLNLYRTVWWLPHSYNTYAIVSKKFYYKAVIMLIHRVVISLHYTALHSTIQSTLLP